MPSSKGAYRNIPRKAQKTFTRDETARSWPSQGVEGEGLGCWSEAKIPCAAAGTDERFLAAAAIQTNMRGYIGGRQPPYAVFWLLFVRTKSNPGYGAGGPESHRITQYLFGEKCFSPTRPAIRESALHRPDAPAPTHPGKENQNSAVPTVRGWGSTSRMLLTPVRYMTIRSKPRPKPAWRQEP